MGNKYNFVPHILILFLLLTLPTALYLTDIETDQAGILLKNDYKRGFLLPKNHSELVLKGDGFNNLALFTLEGEVLKSFTGPEVILQANSPVSTIFLREIPHNKAVSILGIDREGASVNIVVDKVLQHSEAINIEATNVSINAPIFTPKIELLAVDTLLINKIIKGKDVQLLSKNIVYVGENAVVDASSLNGGGSILIGGDYQGKGDITTAQKTYIHPKATIKADALDNGDGGRIIVWADDFAQVYGNISAKGKGEGKGGFIETSGKINLDVKTSPDVSAENGKGGEWLLDPHNIIINNIDANTTAPPNITANANLARINVATILTALAGGNVTISTGSTGTQAGNIDIQVPIDFDGIGGTRSLTLNAEGDINFSGGGIIDSNTGTAEQLNITLNAGGDILGVGQNIESRGGNIQILSQTGGLDIQNLTSSRTGAGTIGNILIDVSGDVNITGLFEARSPAGGVTAGSIDVIANSLTVNAGTAIGTYANTGGAVTINTTGDIDIQRPILSYGSAVRAGDVNLTSTNGRISVEYIMAYGDNAANGGNITLAAGGVGNNIQITGAGFEGGFTGDPFALNVATQDAMSVTGSINIVTNGAFIANIPLVPALLVYNGTNDPILGDINLNINQGKPYSSPGGNIRFNGSSGITSVNTGNWNTPTTWSCTCIPTPLDDVTIAGATTVTTDIASNPSMNNLTVNGTLQDGGNNVDISIKGNLANNGSLNLGNTRTFFDGANQNLNFGVNTLGDVNFTNGGLKSIDSNIDARTITIDPGVTVDGNNSQIDINNSDWTQNGIFNPGTSRVQINGMPNITTSAPPAVFYDLTLGGNGTFTVPITVANNLDISGDFTFDAALDVNGNAQLNSLTTNGPATFAGDFTIASPTFNINAGITFDGGNQTISDNTGVNFGDAVFAGTGTKTFGVGGSGYSFTSMTINAGATLNTNDRGFNGGNFMRIDGTLTCGNATSGVGSWEMNAGATFNPGTSEINIFGSPGDINGTATSVTFYNLGILGDITTNKDIVVTNNFVGGSFNANGQTLSVAGNFNSGASFNAQGGTVLLNGTGAQTATVPNNLNFFNLIINNSGTSDVTFSNNFNITNDLTLSNGYITGAAVTIEDNATMSGSQTGFVKGEVIKVGDDNAFTFHVGVFDGTNIYAPIIQTSTNAGVAGLVSVNYQHNAPGGSPGAGLDALSPVERWTIYSNPNGIDVDFTIPYADANGRNSGVIDFNSIRFAQQTGLGTYTAANSGPGSANGTGQINTTSTINLASMGTQATAFTLANATGGLNWNTNAKIWTGATDNSWNVATNWLPNGIPSLATEEIYFTPTYNVACNIDAAVNAAFIQVESGYTQTITQQESNAILLSGNLNMQGGTFTSAVTTTGNITIGGDLVIGAAGAFTSTAQTLTVTGALDLDAAGTFTANGGSTTLSGTTINGSATAVTFNNLTIAGNLLINKNFIVTGNLTISGDAQANNPINIVGNVNVTGAFVNNSTFTLDGAAQTLSSNAAANLGTIVFGNGTSTKTLGSNITTGPLAIESNVTLAAGANTINAAEWTQDGNLTSSGTVELTGGTGLINGATNPIVFNNLTISGGITLNQSVDVNGTLNTTGTLNGNTETLTLRGNYTNSGTFNTDNGTVAFNGTANQTASGGIAFYDLVINNTTGSFSEVLFDNDIAISNSLTLTNGVLGFNPTYGISPGVYTVTGGGATSYVAGNYGRNVSAPPFTFHIGELATGVYAPVTVNSISAADDMIVVYTKADVGGTAGTGVDALSTYEYWDVLSASGGITAQLEFTYNNTPPRASGVVDDATLRLAKDNGTDFVEITGSIGTGTPSGTITTGGTPVTLTNVNTSFVFANATGGPNYNANAKIWTGATDNSWNVATNWLPNGVPTATSEVFFTSNYTANCTFNDNVNIDSLVIQTGYTGTITHVNGFDITIATGFTQEDGTFNGATGTSGNITIGGDLSISGGTFTSTVFDLSIGGDFLTGGVFNNGVGTVIYNGAAQTIAEVGYNNLSFTGSNTKTYAGATPLNIAGTLDIDNGTTFNPNGQNLTIQGDFIVGATGSLSAAIPTLTMNGTVAQIIDLNAGSTLLADNFVLNNPNGLTLLGELSIGTDLTLTDGIITAENTGDAVIIEALAGITGGSTTSYIDGFLNKQGTSDFTYPVGDNSVYAPVAMTGLTLADNVTIQYLNTPTTGTIDAALETISPVESWFLSGTNGAQATFEFNYDAQSLVNDPNNLRLAQDQAGTFTAVSGAVGSAVTTGTINTGGNILIPGLGADNEFTLANLPGGTNFKTIKTYTAVAGINTISETAKWSGGSLPNAGDVVIISSATAETVTVDVPLPSVSNLTIDANITLDMNGNNLTLAGLLQNDGIFNASTGTHSFALDATNSASGIFNFEDATITFGESFISPGITTAAGVSLAQFTSTTGSAVISSVGGINFNDLIITAGADITVVDPLLIGGNLINNGTFDLITNLTSVLLTADNATADLTINGAVTFYDLIINTATPYNYIYDNDIIVTNTLDLTNGYLLSATGVEKVSIPDYLSLLGGDPLSFVVGPFELQDGTGATGFLFPIGDNGKFAPLTMNYASGTIDNVVVKYIDADVLGTPDNSTIDLVSPQEYWEISSSAGTIVANFDFEYTDTAPRLSGVTDEANLVVAQNVGGTFQATPLSGNGSGNPDGIVNSGDITLPTTTDKQFTFGNTLGGTNTFDVPLNPDNFYWVGSSSNDWNDANNWSFTSGGVAGLVGVPSPTDKVIFDANFTNDCILNVNATVFAAEFLDGSMFTLPSSFVFSVTDETLLIDMGANTFTVPSGSSLQLGGNFQINSDVDFQGTIQFSGITEFINNTVSPIQANEVIVNGELILRDNLIINNQLELAGSVFTEEATELILGNNSGASFNYTSGTIRGNFLQYIDGTTSYLFPTYDRLATLQVNNVGTSGYSSVLFGSLNSFNSNATTEALTFEDATISELLPEGVFKIISTGAAFNYNLEIDTATYLTNSTTNETTKLLSSDDGINWLSEGTSIDGGQINRQGLTLGSNQEKYHAVANSCTKITSSPIIEQEESILLACTIEELNFTLSGVNLPEEEYYRFYTEVSADTIPNTSIAFNEEINKYEILDESILGVEFYAVIASSNGCESPTAPTPITLLLNPKPETPVLLAAEAIQLCEESPLEIQLSSSLVDGETYHLMTSDTSVVFEINSEGNILVSESVLSGITFDENGRFIGEYQLNITSELGCTSDTILVPFEITQLPVVASSQSQELIEVCEGEQISLAIGGAIYERHSYRIAIDSDEDETPDEFVTELFDQGALLNDETNFTRLLESGEYTFYVSVQDTLYGCTSTEQIKLQYVVHKNPNEPILGRDSKLIVCQGEPIDVVLEGGLSGFEEYRWYTTADRQNSLPFLTGKQQQFELQAFINIDNDINQGAFYVETYNDETSCVSNLIRVDYTVLKRPDQPETPEQITICQGEIIDNLLNNGALETPENAGFESHEYRIVKGASQVYRNSLPSYTYSPNNDEFSGIFEVSIVKTYKIDDETFECESFPKSVPFTVNARTQVASVATQAASCNEGGTLQLTIELPKDADGNPVVRSYDLTISKRLENSTTEEPFLRTRTPNANGLIEIPDLVAGDYSLQVNQTNNVNDAGIACGLEETTEFKIDSASSPTIITEQPVIEWDCTAGGNFTGIEIDLGSATFVTYQWYKGNDLSQPIENATTVELLGVAEGIYQLVVLPEGKEDNNCEQIVATYTMVNQGVACAEEVAEEDIQNLCTLKNALPADAQTTLGWPSCDDPNNNPSDWKGVRFDEEGNVVSLNLSNLGLDEINKDAVTSFDKLISIDVSNNKLSFEDLEAIAPLVDIIVADNQDPIGEETDEVTNVNQDITLSIPTNTPGSNGQVTWYFVPEGEQASNAVVVGNSTELTLDNVTPQSNAGTYYAEVTHPDFPNIILKSSEVTLVITEKMLESDREVLKDVLTVLINALNFNNNQRLSQDFDPDAPAASWPGVTQELDRCVGLDFSSFELQGNIPEEIGQLTALRRLSFFDNQLEGELPESIGNLTDLTYLDLDKNNLSGPVPQSITNLTKLKTLWLSRNAFTSLPENMGNLTDLEYLLLQDNQLTEVPSSLGNLNKLKALDISGNKLVNFEVSNSLSQLERLNLSGNALSTFEISLSSSPQLEVLDLSDNELKSLPVGLPISQSLKRLIVRRNLLDFADLEPLNLSITEYSPQKKQEGDESISVLIDAALNLKANIEGSQNQYVWYKDGSPIGSQFNEDYIITQMTTNDVGTYECLVTSQLIPDLTLVTRSITLDADCGDVLNAVISTERSINEEGVISFCGDENIFVQFKTNSNSDLTYTWFKDDQPLTLASDSIYNAFAPGEYKVKIQASSGCSVTSQVITISQSNSIEIDIIRNGDMFEASIEEDVVWVRNGTETVGTGKTFTPTEEGLYQATIDNGSGCISKSDPVLFTITALADEFETGPLTVYPNPAQNNLNVQFPKQQKEVFLTLRYTDGRQAAYFRHQATNEVFINLQGLPTGMYLLEIQSEQGHVIKKVMKN